MGRLRRLPLDVKLFAADSDHLSGGELKNRVRDVVVPEIRKERWPQREADLVAEEAGISSDDLLEGGRFDEDRRDLVDPRLEQSCGAVIPVAEKVAAVIVRYLDVAGAHEDEQRQRCHCLGWLTRSGTNFCFAHLSRSNSEVGVQGANREALPVSINQSTARRFGLGQGKAEVEELVVVNKHGRQPIVQTIRFYGLLHRLNLPQVDHFQTPTCSREGRLKRGSRSRGIKARAIVQMANGVFRLERLPQRDRRPGGCQPFCYFTQVLADVRLPATA